MNMNPHTILVTSAIILAILGLVKPQWPLVPVSCLLLGVAMLIK